MKASIVIPNYNGIELLEKNLPYVINAKKNLKNSILEIIVVDDGSADQSVNFIKKNYPEIRIFKHKVNRGFSAAVNTGVRFSKGGLVVLLNSDVKPSVDFLVSVFDHFKDDRTFGVSLHEHGYSWAKGLFNNGYIVHESCAESKNVESTFWVSGGSGVFRRTVWMELGGMDEKLLSPAYWEDIDICYRARKRGYRLLWDPKAKVEHHHESTVSKLPKVFFERIRERNQLLFIWKNLTSVSMSRKHVVGLLRRIIKSPGYLRIVFMALGKLPTVLKLRDKERRETKVSDEAIFASFSH